MSKLMQEYGRYIEDKLAANARTKRVEAAFAARRKQLPELSMELCRALGAMRGVCKNREIDQYDEDIEALASGNRRESTVRMYLEESGFDANEIRDWFRRARESDFVVTADGFFLDSSDCSFCDYSEEYYSSNTNMFTVRINRYDTQEWAETIADRRAFYCEISDEYYAKNNYTEVLTYDGRTLCEEVANANGWFWSDSYDEWRDEPDSDEDEDEDEDRDDDETTNPEAAGDPRIPRYHSATRRWDYRIPDRSARGWYGFEIEVGFVGMEDRYEFWSGCLDMNRDFCGEKDGSLKGKGVYGLEIITRPFPLQELRREDCILRGLLDTLNEYDIRTDLANFGVHVTANWGRLTLDHQRRLQQAVYDFKPLSLFVARREETPYASFSMSNWDDHHAAAHPRDGNALEVRIFRTTSDYPTLLSYAEYVDALTEWTLNPHQPTKGSMAQAAFRRWVRDSGQYPELAKRLFPEPKPKPIPMVTTGSGPFFMYDITPRAGEYEVCA